MRALLLVLLCFLAGPVLPAPATAPMLATSYRHGVAVPEFLVSDPTVVDPGRGAGGLAEHIRVSQVDHNVSVDSDSIGTK